MHAWLFHGIPLTSCAVVCNVFPHPPEENTFECFVRRCVGIASFAAGSASPGEVIVRRDTLNIRTRPETPTSSEEVHLKHDAPNENENCA